MQPRLDAVELFPTSTTAAIGAEIALLPNSAYFNPLNFWNVMASPPIGTDPFNAALSINTPKTPPTFLPLNTAVAGRAGSTYTFNYASFGEMNESYDAADFQNMFLALQTVTPRAQGRVVQDNGGTPTTLSIDDPTLSPKDFLRLDLEDLPLPSFHRPDLINFWYHRILNSQWFTGGSSAHGRKRPSYFPALRRQRQSAAWFNSAAGCANHGDQATVIPSAAARGSSGL